LQRPAQFAGLSRSGVRRWLRDLALKRQRPALREARVAEKTPEISVVIASVNGPGHLDECLGALEAQTRKDCAEIIVADRCGNGVRDLIARKYPHVRLLSFSEKKTIPELRAMGIRSARGQFIAITEDHCLAEPHWYERMLEAHRRYYGVVGGPVENHPSIRRLRDWAVFFCEYSPYYSPVPTGETADIPGNNISYRREFLPHVADLLDGGGVWEGLLNERLQLRGIRLYCDPSLVVFHKKEFGFGYFASQRYHYSRAYAGMRTQGASLGKRLAWMAATPLLPALLLARITRNVLRKKRYLGKFAAAQPYLWAFLLFWGIGEFVGYLSGPGESLQKVE